MCVYASIPSLLLTPPPPLSPLTFSMWRAMSTHTRDDEHPMPAIE